VEEIFFLDSKLSIKVNTGIFFEPLRRQGDLPWSKSLQVALTRGLIWFKLTDFLSPWSQSLETLTASAAISMSISSPV